MLGLECTSIAVSLSSAVQVICYSSLCVSTVQVECTNFTRFCIFSPARHTFWPTGQELLSLAATCQSTDTISTIKASWALHIAYCIAAIGLVLTIAVASDPCDFRCSVPTIPLTPVCLCLRASALCAFYILHSSSQTPVWSKA